MSTEPQRQKQLLIVDDNPHFLTTVTSMLKELSGGSWAIRAASNHSQALEHLKAQAIDTIVLDVDMPVMDGVEFLRLLNRTRPGQQTVMLADRIVEQTRKTCLELGATLFLEKPVTAEGFRALFTALDSVSTPLPQSGFRGVMQRVGLEDVLQMECLARKSSILVVSTGNRNGQIFICDGEIIHAQSGQLQGEMALFGLLGLSSGEFTLHPFNEPPRRSISGHYQFLLMEAARLRDEATGQPESQGGAKAVHIGAASIDSSVATEARGMRIEEVLLCSSAKEVLYHNKCESIESRMDLMQQLEERAMQASKGTPSGRFHRVWMETGHERVVIQIQPAFKMLVRSMLPPQPTTNE